MVCSGDLPLDAARHAIASDWIETYRRVVTPQNLARHQLPQRWALKNGDQIGRLFDEPADLLVLQHCHEVTSAVRKQMRAYAQQMGNPRRFCIIDGYDTVRMLRAYNKCGLALDDSEAGGT